MLTGSQLVKKFPAFYGTRKFVTAFTSAHHLFVSWARSIQSIPLPHPTFWRSILIFCPIYAWVFQVVSFPQVSAQNPLYTSLSLLYTCYILHLSRSSRFDGWPNRVQITQWRSWLRHCTTSRKVVGSISEGVIEIFHWHNPSSRTMALGSTQLLAETSTRNISWGLKTAGP